MLIMQIFYLFQGMSFIVSNRAISEANLEVRLSIRGYAYVKTIYLYFLS